MLEIDEVQTQKEIQERLNNLFQKFDQSSITLTDSKQNKQEIQKFNSLTSGRKREIEQELTKEEDLN